MNILLLGNGFDLAHGLPTKYITFLKFCRCIEKIYTINTNYPAGRFDKYITAQFSSNKEIYKILHTAFQNRQIVKTRAGKSKSSISYTTQSPVLDEMYTHIKDNFWLKYFSNCHTRLNGNWIDFEAEISRVIQALDTSRELLRNGKSPFILHENKSTLLDIARAKGAHRDIRKNMCTIFCNKDSFDKFVKELELHLKKLTRALELYLAGIAETMEVTKKITEIMEIKPDKVLSFNYTDTYKRLYGINKKIQYDYIHGKAGLSNTLETNTMVLGINEYLPDDRKNQALTFIAFKKYYQRIHKETGCLYTQWLDELEKDGSRTDSKKPDNLYIYGHSLDITDRDILLKLLSNENLKTTIYYINKKIYGRQIINLIKLIGQDELIRRTGGISKTIVFQRLS